MEVGNKSNNKNEIKSSKSCLKNSQLEYIFFKYWIVLNLPAYEFMQECEYQKFNFNFLSDIKEEFY